MTSIPDFAVVPLNSAASRRASRKDWTDLVGEPDQLPAWQTPEKIPVEALYCAADLEEVDHLDSMPGIPPFLRGPYATMYLLRPWTVRQYAGFSTAKDARGTSWRTAHAGTPGRHEGAWRDAGVDRFIFMKCDVLATLREMLQEEGVLTT